MWLNEGGIANLLSIPQLEKDGFRVTSDTHGEWIIHSPQGEKFHFKRDTGALENIPCIDVRDVTEAFAHLSIEAFQEKSLQTVRKNMEGFSRKEVKGAVLARIDQSKVAHPPNSKFKKMVSSPSFKNWRVTAKDITNSRVIFGLDLPGLQRRSTRKKPKRIVPEYMGIPRALYERHNYVTLTAYVMFVNGIAFWVSLSRGIRLYTCEHVPNQKAKQLAKSVRRIVNLYARGGFPHLRR